MLTDLRILIADDHPVVRAGLRQAIEADSHLTVVAETADGETTWKSLQQLQPDVAILDIFMPKISGFGATQPIAFDLVRNIQAHQLPVRIVLLTGNDNSDVFDAALKLGVQGYVLKESALGEIVKSVKIVATGGHFVSPFLAGRLLQCHTATRTFCHEHPGLQQLTPREREVLQLVAAGQASKDIADTLEISFRAVDNHRSSISHKLGLEGPTTLLKFALEHRQQLSLFCAGTE